MNNIEVVGGSITQKKYIKSMAEYCCEMLMPRMKSLDIEIHVKDFKKDDNYGYAWPVDDRLNPREFELEINKHKRTFFYKNKEIFLSKKEFKLLHLLMTNNGKVFNRDEIINAAWEENAVVGSRTIDVHIRKIREKTSENLIKTIKGFGYKLNA